MARFRVPSVAAAGWLVLQGLCLAVAGERGVTLDPTVLILGAFDYLPYQSVPPYTSRCTDMVKRASELRTNRLQFVPTFYWKSGGSGGVKSYCWVDQDNECRPFTQAAISNFERGMQLCLESAIFEHGFKSLTITPHLDNRDTTDGWTIRTWRNGLVFDPRAKYDGWSYEEIMLTPLARTLAPFLKAARLERIDFGLQGEMGASVMRYPLQYSALHQVVRRILLDSSDASGASSDERRTRVAPPGPSSIRTTPQILPNARDFQNLLGLWDTGVQRTGGIPFPLPLGGLMQQAASADMQPDQQDRGSGVGSPEAKQDLGTNSTAMLQSAGGYEGQSDDRVRFGLSFNFIYADGSQRYTTSLLGQLGVAFVGSWFGFRPGFEAPQMDPQAVESLFYEMDFIGISAYHPLPLGFTENELQNSIFNVINGFSSIGIDLEAVLRTPRLRGKGAREIQYVEFGIGGGASQSGSGQASSPQQVLDTPYWGVQGPYLAAKDPWATKEMRAFLHSFYARALKWLHEGTGPTYKLSACFLWNHGSFDVFGIHPESTTKEGTYRDETLVEATAFHNERALNA